jgi:hypothetical protein
MWWKKNQKNPCFKKSPWGKCGKWGKI